MEYKRNTKIKSAVQKRLLFLMEGNLTLWIKNNEDCSIVEMPQEEIQVRTCNQLIKANLIKAVSRETTEHSTTIFFKISLEGKLWCEKSRKRKPSKSDGISEE